MIATKLQKENFFIFYVTPRIIIAHAPLEYVRGMEEAVRLNSCWLNVRAVKDTLEELKKAEEAKDLLVVILNLADAGGDKLKEIFFNKEELANIEENGRMSIVVNKKQFLRTIPPSGSSLKQKIIAQQGVAVLVIDYGMIEVFSV